MTNVKEIINISQKDNAEQLIYNKLNEIKNILLSLIKENEKEYVEYKETKNNIDFNELGRYFSALSNGANLNSLKKEITQSTNDNMTFMDIYEFEIDDVSYTKKSGFNDQYYKDLVLKYIKDFGSITKKDLDNLLMDKLPDNLNIEQKKRKIKYLINENLAKKEQLLKNIGKHNNPIWGLNEKK